MVDQSSVTCQVKLFARKKVLVDYISKYIKLAHQLMIHWCIVCIKAKNIRGGYLDAD